MFDLYQKLLSQLGLIWLIVLAVWHIWQCIWSIGGAVVDYCESGQVRRDSNRDNGRSQISRKQTKQANSCKVQAFSWFPPVQKNIFCLHHDFQFYFLSWADVGNTKPSACYLCLSSWSIIRPQKRDLFSGALLSNVRYIDAVYSYWSERISLVLFDNIQEALNFRVKNRKV